MTVLAFVHIEKSAGTTFIHLLRKNFPFQYMDVRPVIQHGHVYLTARDMRILSKVNPFLRCIAGHSVRCCSDLENWRSDIRYVTILREPISRYVSQFNYWNHRLKKNTTIEQFLADKETWNFQTKKISGGDDLASAKAMLAERFFHVGVVERFDEFLLTLRYKLRPRQFKVAYTTQNAGTGRSSSTRSLVKQYHDEICERNRLDLELYNFVNTEIVPKNRSEYGPTLSADVTKFVERNACFDDHSIKLYFDYIVRKLYHQPITGVIRVLNGLPYHGSYENW